MKFKTGSLLSFLAVAALLGSSAWAQSSGNFAGEVDETRCTVSDTGTGPSTVTSLSTTIKTPNSSETALLIRPSLVTGLFTDTTLTNTVSVSTAVASVTVTVDLDGSPVAPGKDIVYDGRLQEMSDNFLQLISGCTSSPDTCNLTLILATLSAHSFDFLAPDVGGGDHKVDVTVTLNPGTGEQTKGNSGGGESGACAGPGVLSVQQVQTFSQSGGISIQ
jgi:hypothetical protein